MIRHLLLFGLSSLLGIAQDHFEVLLKETPTKVYNFLELKDGSYLCGFRADPPNYLHAVTRFNKNGVVLNHVIEKGSGGVGSGKIKNLGEIAQHPSGALWFADGGQNRLQQFSPEGKHLGSILLQMPNLLTHGIDLSLDGMTVYFGGCSVLERGAYQGCRSILHARKTNGVSQTSGYLGSARHPGWNASEKGFYQLIDERIAVANFGKREIIAYTNLSARRVWLVDFTNRKDIEVRLDTFIPELNSISNPDEALSAYLGKPLTGHLVSVESSFFMAIKNQSESKVGLIEIDPDGKILNTWPRKSLPGELVGKTSNGHLVFAYGNRLRFVQAKRIGKVSFQ